MINIKPIISKKIILDWINDLKAQNIICFNMIYKPQYNITDVMILCTGRSKLHVISIADDLLHKFRALHSQQLYRIEGMDNGEWVLVDLGNIIIHIMQKETRNFYELEKLWS